MKENRQAGKGDKPRKVDLNKYQKNYSEINWNSRKEYSENGSSSINANICKGIKRIIQAIRSSGNETN